MLHAHRELTEDKTTLSEIVRDYIENHRIRNQSITLEELFDECAIAEKKRRRSWRYIAGGRNPSKAS